MKKGYAHVLHATKEVQMIVERSTLYGVTLLQNTQLVEKILSESAQEPPHTPQAFETLVELVAWVQKAQEEAELS